MGQMKCINCDEEVKKKQNKFCDRTCYREYAKKSKVYKNNCVECGEPTNNSKFCSSSCSAKHNNRKREKIKIPCQHCGKLLSGGRHRKFCDQICQHNYNYKIFIKEWKDGLHNGISGVDQISSHLRRYVFEKYNYKCSLCGWSKKNPFTDKIPLEVDHIDGNHKNNSENNLTLICPNCHSLTKTYRGANRGKGRKYRNMLKTKEYNEIKNSNN
jgi:hypothetical protein